LLGCAAELSFISKRKSSACPKTLDPGRQQFISHQPASLYSRPSSILTPRPQTKTFQFPDQNPLCFSKRDTGLLCVPSNRFKPLGSPSLSVGAKFKEQPSQCYLLAGAFILALTLVLPRSAPTTKSGLACFWGRCAQPLFSRELEGENGSPQPTFAYTRLLPACAYRVGTLIYVFNSVESESII
jgi:hypothetical protein